MSQNDKSKEDTELKGFVERSSPVTKKTHTRDDLSFHELKRVAATDAINEIIFDNLPPIGLVNATDMVNGDNNSYLNVQKKMTEEWTKVNAEIEKVPIEMSSFFWLEERDGTLEKNGNCDRTEKEECMFGMEKKEVISSQIAEFPNAVGALSDDGRLFGLSDVIPMSIRKKQLSFSTASTTPEKNSMFKFKSSFMKPLHITDPFGQEIIISSASFVLLYAAYKVLPHKALGVRHGYCLEETPLTCGLYIDVVDDHSLTEAEFKAIQQSFYEIVAKDIPITSVTLSEDEVLRRFKKQRSHVSHALLKSMNLSYSYVCYEIGEEEYITLRRRPFTPTSSLLHFGEKVILDKEKRGMILRLRGCRPVPRSTGLDAAFERAIKWGNATQTGSIGDINEKVLHNSESLIRLEEMRFDNEVIYCAMSALRQRSHLKIVLISGPSASGKTTFAIKLALAFKSLGKEPVVMSTDDYYRDIREPDYPVLPDGSKDCEVIDAIRLPLLRRNLKELMEGKCIEAPIFNMISSKPKEKGTMLKLGTSGILIMEGIFTLNPRVTEGVDPEGIFSIFISPMPFFFLDEQSFIKNSVMRLIRRIVRDYLHRGRDASASIKRLKSVSRGEVNTILPYISSANYFFNSAMAHELPVLRTLSIPLLRKVVSSDEIYPTAQQLLKILNCITSCSDRYVPNTSLLCEFIGGSIFEKKKLIVESEQRPVLDARANHCWGMKLDSTHGVPITVKDALLNTIQNKRNNKQNKGNVNNSKKSSDGISITDEMISDDNLLAAVLNGELVSLSKPITVYDEEEREIDISNPSYQPAKEGNGGDDANNNSGNADCQEDYKTGLFVKPILVGGYRSSEIMRATVTFLVHVAVRKLWPTRHIVVRHGFGSQGSDHYSGCSYFVRLYDEKDKQGQVLELRHDQKMIIMKPGKSMVAHVRKEISTRDHNKEGLANDTIFMKSCLRPAGKHTEGSMDTPVLGALSPFCVHPFVENNGISGNDDNTDVVHNENPVVLADEDLVNISNKMDELVDKKAKIIVKSVSGPTAMHYFQNAGMSFTAALLGSRNLPTVDVICCEKEMALYIQPLAPHCGYVDKDRFALYPYADGLTLVFDYAEGVSYSNEEKSAMNTLAGTLTKQLLVSPGIATITKKAEMIPSQKGSERAQHALNQCSTTVDGYSTSPVGVTYVMGNPLAPGGPMSPIGAALPLERFSSVLSPGNKTGSDSSVAGTPNNVNASTDSYQNDSNNQQSKNTVNGKSNDRFCHIEKLGAPIGATGSAFCIPDPECFYGTMKDDPSQINKTLSGETIDSYVTSMEGGSLSNNIFVINGSALNMSCPIYQKFLRNKRLLPPIVSAARVGIQVSADSIRCATGIDCVGNMNNTVLKNECMTVFQVSNAVLQRKMNKLVSFVKSELCHRSETENMRLSPSHAKAAFYGDEVSQSAAVENSLHFCISTEGNHQKNSSVGSHIVEGSSSKQIGEAAGEETPSISEQLHGLVILIAGSSSSGKTVLTDKLTVHLKTAEITTRTLSMDNYYRNGSDPDYPKTAAVGCDYESVHVMKLNEFEHDVRLIMTGHDVETPVFDIGKNKRKKGAHILVKGVPKDGVLICEGMFALNELILPSFPRRMKLRIVVHPTSILNIDELHFVSHRVFRILRRIVREYLCRYRDARDTLTRWNNVSNGDDRNVIPFIDNADVSFNTSTIYEVGAIKCSVLPLLEQVSPLFPEEYEHAIQLRALLQWYHDIPDGGLPQSETVSRIIYGSGTSE